MSKYVLREKEERGDECKKLIQIIGYNGNNYFFLLFLLNTTYHHPPLGWICNRRRYFVLELTPSFIFLSKKNKFYSMF